MALITAPQSSALPPRLGRGGRLKLKELAGSGDKIGLVTLPFLSVGVVLNVVSPALFSVGGPPPVLEVISVVVLTVGLSTWAWSVALVLTKVPKHELITTGPYSLVKHPVYTSAALLVLPALGFVLDTWLGAVLGIVLYAATRRFAPEEERALSKTFGAAWDEYSKGVVFPWL